MTPQLLDTLLNVSIFVFVGILIWLFLKEDSESKK